MVYYRSFWFRYPKARIEYQIVPKLERSEVCYRKIEYFKQDIDTHETREDFKKMLKTKILIIIDYIFETLCIFLRCGN